MCLAVQGVVKGVSGGNALVDHDGVEKEAVIACEDVAEGDRVLVQQGLVVEVLRD